MDFTATADRPTMKVVYLKKDNKHAVDILYHDGGITYDKVINHVRETKECIAAEYTMMAISKASYDVVALALDETEYLDNCYVFVSPREFFGITAGRPEAKLHANICNNEKVAKPKAYRV